MSITFQFFAYDECMSEAAVRAAAGGIAPTCAAVPAVLEGYALRFSAVSCASPRLGLPNLLPVSDATVEATDPNRSVFGVLHTLPESARPALLRHMALRGSYNLVSADVTVHLLGASAESPTAQATVIAALDLNWLSVVKAVPDSFAQSWMPLPLPQPSAASADAAVGPGKGGSKRWPGYHWCNCIATARTAPTKDTLDTVLSSIESGVTQKVAQGTTVHQALQQYEAALRATATRAPATDTTEARTWYLAYGSNMSWEQLCVRVGPPYQRRAAKLADYVLIANKVPADASSTFGYYNVEPVADRTRKATEGLTKGPDPMPAYVCGAAYEISATQLALMDGYEWGYTRQWLPCEDIGDSLGLTGADTGASFACGDEAPASAKTLTGAWAYIATDTSEKLMPSAEYLSRVLEGEDAVPAEYAHAIRHTPTNVLRSPRQEKRLRKEL